MIISTDSTFPLAMGSRKYSDFDLMRLLRYIPFLYSEIHEQWCKRLGPHFLPHNLYRDILSYFEHESRRKETSHVDQISIADRLVFASVGCKYGAQNVRTFEGDRIALLDDGLTAFVPAAAKEEDVICTINIEPFVVLLRRLEIEQNLSIDASIRSVFDDELWCTRPEYSTENTLKLKAARIDLYSLVGSCILDDHTKYLEDYKGFQIFALH